MKNRLLDSVREKIRLKHYSYATESSYVSWIKRYILYHDKRHPSQMGKEEIESFLRHLEVEQNISSSRQNQALSALVFLYTEVLEIDIEDEGYNHTP